MKGRGRLEITPPASSRNAEGITGGSRSNLLVGKGSAVASVAFMWKTLLCWCTEDVELASTATDLGFLSFTGVFSLFAITEEFRNTRTFLLQACLSHIFLETVFEWGVLRAGAQEAEVLVGHGHPPSGPWPPGFAPASGRVLLATSSSRGPGWLARGHDRVSCCLQGRREEQAFQGKRRAFFAVAMPVAFVWSPCTRWTSSSPSCGRWRSAGRKAILPKWQASLALDPSWGATCSLDSRI